MALAAGGNLACDALLVLDGLWLLVLRPVLIRTGALGQVPGQPRFGLNGLLLQVACGASLALYGPLLPWPGSGVSFALAAALGIVLSLCHFMVMAMVGSLALAFAVAGLFWQLGACRADVAILHPLLFAVVAALTLRLFVFRPQNLDIPPEERPLAMWRPFLRVLVPLLGGLLLAAGTVGLAEVGLLAGTQVEPLLLRALSPTALVSEAPCPAAAGDSGPVLWLSALWLGAAACGMALQTVLSLKWARTAREGEVSEDLVASLLTINDNKDKEGANGADNLQKPTLGQTDDRFRLVCAAFYAEEGSDLSHLTENERKIVEICRKDEFERDRFIWGGGLI